MNQEFKDWLDLDINQLELKPLSTEQKMNIKKHVLSKTKVKKQFKVRYLAAAAFLGISIVTVSFMTLPAIANQLPFIQRILTYFEEDTLPNMYPDLATIVNQVQSSNGIDIMIENAVYDGTSIFLMYAIKTKTELGDNPRTEGFVEVEQANGFGGSDSIKKINDNTYVGIKKLTPHFKGDSPEDMIIKWQPKVLENIQTNKQFEGDWTFEFKLTQLPTNVQLLNQTMEIDGVTLVIKSLEQSEMTTVIEYEFYAEKSIIKDGQSISIEMVEAKDNLGNVYKINSNGGVSNDNGDSYEWGATLSSLDPYATSLTLTPQVYFSKGSGEILEKTNMKPIKINLK